METKILKNGLRLNILADEDTGDVDGKGVPGLVKGSYYKRANDIRGTSRAWAFTSYNQLIDWESIGNDLAELGIGEIVVGRELCPTTGRMHYQGCVNFLEPAGYRKMQDIVGDRTMCMGKCYSSWRKNVSYCSKDADVVLRHVKMDKRRKRNAKGSQRESENANNDLRDDRERVLDMFRQGRDMDDARARDTYTRAKSRAPTIDMRGADGRSGRGIGESIVSRAATQMEAYNRRLYVDGGDDEVNEEKYED